MTLLSGQIVFVFLLFIIYLLPRVYKNFLLTCIVYLVMILVDDDRYFRKCAYSDHLCKTVNISFIIVFGIHLIFGILLIIGDIKVKIIALIYTTRSIRFFSLSNRKTINWCFHGFCGGSYLRVELSLSY